MGESVPDVMDVVSFPNTNAARTVTPPPATANERRSANERGSRTLFANATRTHNPGSPHEPYTRYVAVGSFLEQVR